MAVKTMIPTQEQVPTILITRRWPAEVEAALDALYCVSKSLEDRPMERAELASALATFDYICPTITDRFDASLLLNVPLRTKALCNFGAGVDHIDIAACRGAGIQVTNTPGVLTEDTADLAILLAMMCARRAGEGERLVRDGKWGGWAPTHLLGNRVAGKIFGVVGIGRIGQAAAARARGGFGMSVIYASRTPASPEVEAQLETRRVELDELFAQADIISLHVPGGPETHHLVDARRLSLMKRSAVIVNTARGEIIDEAALAAALSRGAIAAAGLDVHAAEPRVSTQLLALENVVLLPHLGSATLETRTAMGMRAVTNLNAIVSGQVPPDLVT